MSVYNFTVKTTDAQGLICEKPQSITVDSGTNICDVSFTDRFRIKSYVDGMIGGCGLINAGGTPFNGNLALRDNDSCGANNSCRFIVVNGFMSGVTMNGYLGFDIGFWDSGSVFTPPSDCVQWFFNIYGLLPGFFPVTIWRGYLPGSDHTDPTDSPVGIFQQVNGCAAGPATLEIEQY